MLSDDNVCVCVCVCVCSRWDQWLALMLELVNQIRYACTLISSKFHVHGGEEVLFLFFFYSFLSGELSILPEEGISNA